MTIEAFFKNSQLSDTIDDVTYSDGYVKSLIYHMENASKRELHIHESKVNDYITVENDPNYRRANITNTNLLEKYTSKVGLYQQKYTMLSFLKLAVNIKEFHPDNILHVIALINNAAGMPVNIMPQLSRGFMYTNIKNNFGKDLLRYYVRKYIGFNDLSLFYTAIKNNMPLKESIKNNGFRTILSLPIQKFVPKSMLGVLETLQFLDKLETLYSNETQRQAKQDAIQAAIVSTQNKKIDEIVTVSSYENPDIELTDVLGVNKQTAFKDTIIDYYTEALEDADIEDELIEIIISDFTDNVDTALSGKVGLPSLRTSVKAVKTEVYNKTVTAITTAVNDTINEIVKSISVKPVPAGTEPIDYLRNLKFNIERLKQMESQGTTSADFSAVRNEVAEFLVGGDVTSTNINLIAEQLEELLHDEVTEVC